MFVSIIKYSRKCSSFYVLINKIIHVHVNSVCLNSVCLLIKLDVRDQGQKNNAVSV